MRTAFLGLGLVGGSIARALREASGTGTEWHLTAWTPGGSGPRVAREAGVLDAVAATPGEAVEGADLIVLAAPPIACQGLLRDLAGSLRGSQGPDTVITDVASTKGAIVDLAGTLALRFVGGHPMAGRETSGFGAADAKLFQGRPWVLVPSSDVAAVGRVEAVVGACGARVVRMGAADHDAAVAAISHLPLVLSAALVEAVAGRPDRPRVDWAQAAQLAATWTWGRGSPPPTHPPSRAGCATCGP